MLGSEMLLSTINGQPWPYMEYHKYPGWACDYPGELVIWLVEIIIRLLCYTLTMITRALHWDWMVCLLGLFGYFGSILTCWESHYSDVIMSTMVSQITHVWIVCSTICSGVHQRKHQSSTSLAFVSGIHWWQGNSLHKGPVMRKMFPFDYVIMVRLKKWHRPHFYHTGSRHSWEGSDVYNHEYCLYSFKVLCQSSHMTQNLLTVRTLGPNSRQGSDFWLILNSSWPGDIIWQHRSGSTLVQVMTSCPLAASRYLNQCWLIIRYSDIHLRAISQGIPQPSITKIILKITYQKFSLKSSGASELIHGSSFMTWWHHDMEMFSMLLALCEGNPPVNSGFPEHQGPVIQSFEDFFLMYA